MTTVERAWGHGAAMNPLETIMWRAESDPSLRATMLAVEILETAPTWVDVVELHRQALERVPRLRQRVVEPQLGLGAPRWSDDAGFDLDLHLRRMRLPEGATFADLLQVAEQIAMAPFDRHRPPWEAVLVEGLPDGRAAYVLKLHHASTDGQGTMQLMAALHGVPETDPTAHQVFDRRARMPVLRGSLRRGVGYGLSLQRVLSPKVPSPSPLLSARSSRWRLGVLDVELAALRAAAKVAGGSVNDGYLAALLGGYRIYHEAMGSPVEAVPMAIPVSVRRPGDPSGGNRFTSVRLSGPVGQRDPRARIAALSVQVRAARAEPALDGLGAITPLLARLPGPVIAQVAGGMARGNDLQASNVIGALEPVFLAGAKVERLYPIAPLPGCPAMVTMVSHGATCCVGVNYDPAAFTDGDLFLSSLEAGFAEVLELVGAGEAARWVR